MPLPGESLVAFLSDGAFEEQRGSDWTPRWWRAEDSGFAIPVMILNGRRNELAARHAFADAGLALVAHMHRHLHPGLKPAKAVAKDRTSVVWGQSMTQRLALGGTRIVN